MRSETGQVLARGDAYLAWAEKVTAGLDPERFPMLAGICPYLNRLPVERQGPWVTALQAMCQVAAAGPHRYVWLLGD